VWGSWGQPAETRSAPRARSLSAQPVSLVLDGPGVSGRRPAVVTGVRQGPPPGGFPPRHQLVAAAAVTALLDANLILPGRDSGAPHLDGVNLVSARGIRRQPFGGDGVPRGDAGGAHGAGAMRATTARSRTMQAPTAPKGQKASLRLARNS
jgi:hypothetical protein